MEECEWCDVKEGLLDFEGHLLCEDCRVEAGLYVEEDCEEGCGRLSVGERNA